MRNRDNDVLEALIVEGPPLNPASHDDIIYYGFRLHYVDGLDLFLRHVKVDQAILDKYCGQAHNARHSQQLIEVLCTTQPWLEPELKEPGCE
jgi:hypothetical protein